MFQQVRATTEDRGVEIPEDLQRILPGQWVYVKMFKRKWDQPRREGPYKVVRTFGSILITAAELTTQRDLYPGLEPDREQLP